MTERFRLAANVLLKRRLNNLVRIDNNIEIDCDFITCAEYQLFIDEMRREGKNRQPDLWTAERFPPEKAKQPITGIRAEDAEEFCRWLTKKESVAGFSYRLPGLTEAREIPATRKNIGCWSKAGNTYSISGIAPEQWQNWEDRLAQYLVIRGRSNKDRYQSQVFKRKLYLNQDFDVYPDRHPDIYQYLNRYVNRYLDIYRDSNLKRRLFLNFKYDLYRNKNLNFHGLYEYFHQYVDRYFDLCQVFDLNQHLDFERYLALYRDLCQGQDLNQYLYFNLNLYQDFYLEINNRKISNLSLVCFFLIFFIIFYQSFTRIFEDIVKYLKEIDIDSLECLYLPKYVKLSRRYAWKRDEIYSLYVHLVLLNERMKGNMPAWEGIRIIRERS